MPNVRTMARVIKELQSEISNLKAENEALTNSIYRDTPIIFPREKEHTGPQIRLDGDTKDDDGYYKSLHSEDRLGRDGSKRSEEAEAPNVTQPDEDGPDADSNATPKNTDRLP